MKCGRHTPLPHMNQLAELVCSNSLKSESEGSAPWAFEKKEFVAAWIRYCFAWHRWHACQAARRSP